MDIMKLKEEIKHFDIENRAIQSFWDTLEKYKSEDIYEYKKHFIHDDINKFYIAISSISLKLGNWPECSYNHLVVRIPIWYNESHMGDYLVMFTLDGEIDDDMLNVF